MATRTKIGWLALSLALVASACNATNDVVTASTTRPESTTSSTAPPGRGRLVVLDAGGQVVAVSPEGDEVTRLTDDSGEIGHWQPLWDPEGRRVSWGETTPSGFALVIADGNARMRIQMPSLPFFSMWSPDGSQIGVLHDAPGGLDLEIVDVGAGTSEVVASGAPFYFSWSPDGVGLVDHVGASILSLIEADGVTVLGPSDGAFQAPWWTQEGIYTVEDGALMVRDRTGAAFPIASVGGPVTIVASPDGKRIAVQVFDADSPAVFAAAQSIPAIPGNAVVVFDVEDGRVDVVSRQSAFAFFWSPDAESLLFMVPAEAEGEVEWRVWRDGETVVTVRLAPAVPFLRDLAPFFDQYAQAWTPWAPDSQGFAFVGSIDAVGGVWVQDLDADAPRFLVDGSWVAWSAAG